MRLNDYLKEMTMDQAFAVFGLQRGADPEEIKNRYKKLALMNHPDRGGSLEAMKDVNNAWDLLKKVKSGGSSSGIDWKKTEQEYRNLGVGIKNKLSNEFHYHADLFLKHFEELTGKKFRWEYTRVYPTERTRGTPYSAGYEIQFTSEDKETIFSFEVSANLTDIKYSKGLGWADNVDFTLFIMAYGLHDSRKVKISRSNYSWSNNHNVLRNPELIFPANKLKKILKTVGSKEFKKKDMEVYLMKKLDARLDGEFARIPLMKDDPKFHLLMYRNVFMRIAGWGMNGVYDNFKRIAMGPYFTLPENEESARWLEEVQKAAYRAGSKEAALAAVMKMAKEKEAERKAKS
jgi:curved DNA-binding protein CbpA